MSNLKIIFSDVDGTVLSSDGTVTEENRSILQKVLRMGHRVAISTGRSVRGAWPIIEALGLDCPGAYLLAYQGAVIYDCGQKKILDQDGMPGEVAMELMSALDAAGIYAHTFDEDGILAPRECEELREYCRITPENYHIMKDFSELQGMVLPKVIAIDYRTDEKMLQFQKDFADREAGRLNSFFSSTCYLEYCKEGCHKGSGLVRLTELLNWPISDTVAVGDERNDISMLQAAGVGVAMQNARTEVKAVADYVTERDCDHSGVAEAVRKFVLGEEV